MTNPQSADESSPETDKGKNVESRGKVNPNNMPGSDSKAASADAPVAPNKLTPEEQMALFEKDLKENDWGHQPC